MLRKLTICYAAVLASIVLLANVGAIDGLMDLLHDVPMADKVCHFFFVGGLSFLVTATLGWHHPRHRYQLAALAILAICVLTSLEELSQTGLSHRNFDVRDMLCNIAGSWCLGLSALLLPDRHVVEQA